ncbi:MAG: PEP/pyruvate-binding domain-containing protein [Longimicrobiaceae bacterium]
MTSSSPPSPAVPADDDPLWILTPRGPTPGPAEIGGKAYGLVRLARSAPVVPPFFVVRAGALMHLLGGGTLPETEEEAQRVRERAARAPLSDALSDALREALEAIGHGPLAVRSSAVGEDGARSSFAGQFETVLGVSPDADAVWRAVCRVWASAFHPRAEAYRRERGERAEPMAVVVQRLVEPETAGVAFSVDPVTGDGATAVVSAVYGLGEGLVSGALDADTYSVRTAPGGGVTVEAQVARKRQALRFDPAAAAVRVEEVAPGEQGRPALSDAEARAIAEHARELAAVLGAEQDVEWALAPGPDGPRHLFLLQARPITTLGEARPAALRVWDNESLVESLPGVTLPLTYSVARRAFAHLYVGHCLALGAPERDVADHREAFDDIVGLVRGRAYHDMAALTRALLLIPGTVLRDGAVVPTPTPPAVAAEEPLPATLPPDLLLAARAFDAPAEVLRDTARLGDALDEFRARVREVLDPLTAADFGGEAPDELRRHYERLDRGLMAHWLGPMLSDVVLQHWTGLLQQAIKRWLPGVYPGAMTNQLVAGASDLVSAEPVRLLAALARRARGDARLHALLTGDAASSEVWEALHADPAFAELAAGLREFQERFGDRCPDELKLEAESYAESPEPLVQALRACAAAGEAPAGSGEERRAGAEAFVRERLPPDRSAPFSAVVDQVRRGVAERENARFQRTRAFGVIRRLFAAMGARLAGAGALADPRDVFYLAAGEVFAWLDGHSASGDLRPLVDARRAEFEGYRLLEDPPPRFATRGPPALSALEPVTPPGMPPPGPDGMLRGRGCCPGVVRAAVRVVRDPRQPGELAGRILVAEQTDPGWTLLFPAVAGVLVERGSILSHAALVARELGVPCVVGIPRLLDVLRDGEVVEMDGVTGIVRRLPPPGTEPA